YLRAAIQRAPDRVDLYVSLVESLMESSRWQEAESLVREALRVDFRVPELHYDLGRILEQRGDRQAAAAAYRRALEVDPAFLPARLRLESLQPSTPGR
ncbi:MAG TPA: tetratricopeptide repeat protein, partial [Limnochordales bacterium]